MTKKMSKPAPAKGKSPAGVSAKPVITAKQIRQDIRKVMLDKLSK